MGIDIYMKWDGMTEKDKKKQVQGWSRIIGHTGYLREAYHGSIYPSEYLLKEAFEFEYPKDYDGNDEEMGYVRIPSSILVERLPKTIELAMERNRKTYNTDFDTITVKNIKSYIDFVALAVKLEKQGKNPRILASY